MELTDNDRQRIEHPQQDIIEFLCGSGTYDSLWWGDIPHDKRSTFWWRSKLRDHVKQLEAERSELRNKVIELHQKVIATGFHKFDEQKRYIEELPILARYLLNEFEKELNSLRTNETKP